MDNWYKTRDKLPEVGVEVLVFNKNYKHDDFNPTGVTIGYQNDFDNFVVQTWDAEHDCYWGDTISKHSPMYPTHWQYKPAPPKD